MHIPDGYLSPSTCATLYAASAPFWYVSLRRARSALNSRAIPLLSVFAAFSFVIMMFNLPLPGGTTGHAVGMGMAAIILGPWISILAISAALLVQALLFGDGGITTFGANSFNMAIVGSLVSIAVYKVLAYRAGLTAPRRAIAAGLAGYVAINCAALCAAIEFGIQPLLFHDASGTPLYAPYSLSVSIPAMMLGHLTFAGLAEFVISAGMIAYIQRTDPSLLGGTKTTPAVSGKLWFALAVFLVLTPLGIIAAGTAWGEWRPSDFAHAPLGLERLSHLWRAPMAGYAPTFVRGSYAGYFISAIVGVAILLVIGYRCRRRGGFIEKTIRGLTRAADEALFAEEFARTDGFLQGIDARAKMIGLGSLVLASIAVHRLSALAGLLLLALILGFASHVRLGGVMARVLAFTGLIALPAIFLTPQGVRAAAILILRAECAAVLVYLLIVTTYWNHILRSLRWFRVPASVVALLEISYRYIFVMLQTAQSMFESRQTRLMGRLAPAEQRRFASSAAAVLLDKAFQLSGEVHLAMLARGFRGNIVLLDELRMTGRNWLQAGLFLAVSGAAFWVGR